MSNDRQSLKPGTRLNDYIVKSLLARGGFSLVYLAIDEETGNEVVIKEFLPKRIAARDKNNALIPRRPKYTEDILRARKLFFQEAKALAGLRHPNIVLIHDFFLANNTGYLIMEYELGRNLGNYIQERGGKLSTAFILEVFVPVLDALALIHSRSLLHLDVKPGNIHLRHGNYPILLDLGAVHTMSHGRTRGGQVITAGYSPVEQYYRGGHIGPWSDVYAVGASIRTCIEGKPPPTSIERRTRDSLIPAKLQFNNRYPPGLLAAIDRAMEMDPTKRPKDAGELLQPLRQLAGEIPNSELSRAYSQPTGPRREDWH